MRGRTRGIRSGALHVVSRDKKLTIRVENIRQWNCTCLVSPLRKIASARKRSNFTLQFLEAHLRLRKLHQRVLHIFGGSQGGLPILGKRFGVGPARLRDLGCDLSKIEKPPSQRSRPNRLKRLPVKKSAPVDAVETKRAGKRNLRVVVRNRTPIRSFDAASLRSAAMMSGRRRRTSRGWSAPEIAGIPGIAPGLDRCSAYVPG
jgi:hypothetical protein